MHKSLNEQGNIFNEIIINVLRNFIPHETVLCDDRVHRGLIIKLSPLYAKKI